MIPAASIQDQELPIAAKWSGVNYPTVAWRGDLGAGMRGDGLAFLGSTDAIGCAELANFRAIDGQTQMSARCREGDRRGQPAGVFERREVGPGRILLDPARFGMGGSGGGVEA